MASPGARTAPPDSSPSSNGRELAALAEIDARLRELEGTWKAVARRLDASRRELSVAAAQLQRARSLAARPPRHEEDEPSSRKRPAPVLSEESHHVRLLEQFVAELKEAETQRLALHDETERLRRRRESALRQLPAAARTAYEAALRDGRVPVITGVTAGVCDACSCRLLPPVTEGLGVGAVQVCPGCGRLLCPSP